MRIAHVLSVAILAQDILDFAYMAAGRASRLFFSLPQAPAEDVPRADIFRIVFSIFRVGIFSSLFGFLVGGLSIHNNFSTSAAICALGDNMGDRNRVTG